MGNVEVPASQDCAFVEPLESSNGTLWSTAREKYILLTQAMGYATADQTCKDKGGGLPMIRNAVEYLALKGKSQNEEKISLQEWPMMSSASSFLI